MPTISPEDKNLIVLNLFTTDAPEKQDQLIEEMTKIVNAATYEGWKSSTVHSGILSHGTANFIQWRSGEDLEKRYEGEEFKHRTLPVFGEITTSIRLLQNDVAYTLTRDGGKGGAVEIGPHRGVFTVITIFGVAPENQDELVDALGEGQNWLVDVPGFQSHIVLKGLRARGLDGLWVASYSQWDSQEAFDTYRDIPADKQSEGRIKAQDRTRAVATYADLNTYNVVHTRSAE
ncbi:antibiotic biosynthesis monooxygenase family protein [Streptomyces sp. NPDC005209]|uniref:antibiotic biosynthesis monooxygenase family protein n=1 Tax=Streptomyces sp. NPDC005209 TaxID=3156715 RepID=UPI0033B3CBE3